jgi:hypothetical protein
MKSVFDFRDGMHAPESRCSIAGDRRLFAGASKNLRRLAAGWLRVG